VPVVVNRAEVGGHAKLHMSGGRGDVVMASDQAVKLDSG
jgi:hypothetical protein